MNYFLGVDGGGSKTYAVVVDENGKEVGYGIAGSVDILNETKEEFKDHLFAAVHEALKKADLDVKSISSACFGMPAVGDVEGMEKEITPFIEELKVSNFIIVNDVRVALEGAFPMKKGAILLAGTGAMVMAKDEKGDISRIDGWGEHVGDLGSGYFIGQLILRRAFEEYDGRSSLTPILKMVKEFANVEELREILIHCKGSNVRKYIASFSKVACEAAKRNVKPAQKILDEAVHELVKSVKALGKIFGMGGSIPFSTVGGVFKCEYLFEKFKREISALKNITLVEKEFEPHMGAVIMAARELLSEEKMQKFYQGLRR